MLADRILTYAAIYISGLDREPNSKDEQKINSSEHVVALGKQIEKIYYSAMIELEYFLTNYYLAHTLTHLPNYLSDQPSINRLIEFEQKMYEQESQIFTICQKAFQEFTFDCGAALFNSLTGELNVRFNLVYDQYGKKSWLSSLWRTVFPINFQLVKQVLIEQGECPENLLFNLAEVDSLTGLKVVQRMLKKDRGTHINVFNEKFGEAVEKVSQMYRDFSPPQALEAIKHLPAEHRILVGKRIDLITAPYLDKQQEKVNFYGSRPS